MAGLIVWGVTHKLCALYTCDKGLILKQSITKFHVIRWDEIEIIWQTSARTFAVFFLVKSRLYAIRCHDGYTLAFNGISKTTLNGLVKMPAVVEAYQAGQTLSFGPVQVNQQGIAVGARLLPWSQVKSVSLQGKQLAIYDITQRSHGVSCQRSAYPIYFCSLRWLIMCGILLRNTSEVEPFQMVPPHRNGLF